MSETLEELKIITERACDVHVNYYATTGKNKLYFSHVPDVDGCDMWLVGHDGKLIKTDMDSVCTYGFDSFRSLSDIERIIELMEIESDIRAALKTANIQNRKLLDKTDNLKEKIKDIGYSYRRVEQERDELKILKFKKFNDEECWLYQGDGNDYLESLVCPVVISPEKLIDIINGDL